MQQVSAVDHPLELAKKCRVGLVDLVERLDGDVGLEPHPQVEIFEALAHVPGHVVQSRHARCDDTI